MERMATVVIGLGANVGDPAGQLAEAVRQLGRLGTVRAVSSGYRTRPVGPVAQADFLNAVCILETGLPPEDLLAAVQEIEARIGRVREVRYGPRSIDIDLLDYDGAVLRTERLVLPHEELARRTFVLVPLAEIAPGWRHPVLGMSARELLGGGEVQDGVQRTGPLPLRRAPSTETQT